MKKITNKSRIYVLIPEEFESILTKAYYDYISKHYEQGGKYKRENLSTILELFAKEEKTLLNITLDAFKPNQGLNKEFLLLLEAFCKQHDRSFTIIEGVHYRKKNEVTKSSGIQNTFNIGLGDYGNSYSNPLNEGLRVLVVLEKLSDGYSIKNEAKRAIEIFIEHLKQENTLPFKIIECELNDKVNSEVAKQLSKEKNAQIVFWGRYISDSKSKMLKLGYFLRGLNEYQRIESSAPLSRQLVNFLYELEEGVLPIDIKSILLWVSAQDAYLSNNHVEALRLLDSLETYFVTLQTENPKQYGQEKLEIQFRRSVIYIEQEALDNAKKEIDILLRDEQGILTSNSVIHSKLLHNYGIVYARKGNYTEAIHKFEASNKIQEHWSNYTQLGQCFLLKDSNTSESPEDDYEKTFIAVDAAYKKALRFTNNDDESGNDDQLKRLIKEEWDKMRASWA